MRCLLQVRCGLQELPSNLAALRNIRLLDLRANAGLLAREGVQPLRLRLRLRLTVRLTLRLTLRLRLTRAADSQSMLRVGCSGLIACGSAN